MTLPEALAAMSRHQGSAIGRMAVKIRHHWEAEGSAHRAFLRAGFPPRDAAFVEAGENSGHLEEIFGELAAYYHQLDHAKKTIIAKSLYPLFIFHFGVLVLALPAAVQGGLPGYLGVVWPFLAGFYALAIIFYFFGAAIRRSLAESVLAARTILGIPVLGGFLRIWTAWNFSLVLALYIRAGGGLLRAFELAGKSSGNAALDRATTQALQQVRTGAGLAESFRIQRYVPEPLLRAIEVGEHAGRLDTESARCAETFKTSFLRNLDLVTEWLPRLLYVAIVLTMAWIILRQAFSLGDQFNSILNQ